MALTPADVHNVAFKKPPIGKRGYDEDEVDAFLDLVEAELARLIEENAELKKQAAEIEASSRQPGHPGMQQPPQQPPAPPQQPQQPVHHGPPPQEPPSGPIHQPPAQSMELTDHDKASRVLALASETADRHVAEARAEAERLMGEGRTSRDQIMADARGKADQLLADAKTRSDALLSDARARAENLDREARTKAQALTQEAERKHAEVMGGLEERKNTLERQIEQLRTWEREYRTRLKGFLESQLSDLNSWGSAEPADVARGNANVPVSAAAAGAPGPAGQPGRYGAPAPGAGRPQG